MRTVLLSDLITDVRRRADIENATGRHSDTELTAYINQSIARLYLILDRLDSCYYMTRSTITTANGTSAYALPDDFWSLKGVNINISEGNDIRCRKYSADMGPWLRSMGAWGASLPIYYRLIGKDAFSSITGDDAAVNEYIEFAPIPAGSYTVTIEYTPAPQKLVDGTNEFDGLAGFEEWVVLDAAIKVKRKDNLDASALMSDKAEVEAWIVSNGTNRDQGQPECVQDLQSDEFYSWPWSA